MKKEILAISMLVLIFLLSLYTIKILESLTGDLAKMVSDAAQMASEEDWDGAVNLTEAAIQKWHDADSYTHITLRHFEIDSTTDAFYNFLEKLYTKDSGGQDSAFLMLTAHLEGIARMEHISPGSVF